MATQQKHVKLFKQLLELSALLPRADKDIAKRYKLSRKQIYLIYLVYNDDPAAASTLSTYARWLNISNSTLTRNIEKLEERKILLRMPIEGKRGIGLKLLSHGQLHALEIDSYMAANLGAIDTKQLRGIV